MRSFFVLAITILLLPDTTNAATEYATFGAFYKESSSIGWILAAVAALISAAVIFFTGGTASPIVVSIGSWIGSMMGLSGAAATNAGLALLGGGSIASGGFGIVGGTVVLTTALSFGTDVVFDYTIGETVSAYKYSSLREASQKMITLPLPKNHSGSDTYEDTMEILETIDDESPIYSKHNQQIINHAITKLEKVQDNSDNDISIKDNALLALLYFVSNDYIKAKKYSDLAIKSARTSKIRRTLPAFIYATSSLYEKHFDFEQITKNYFRYAVLAEADNPLISLLFSIYLDRMSLRFNDGFLNEKSLQLIFEIMQSPSLKDDRIQNYTILLTRYFMRLKLEQQKISSLSTTLNKTIRKSPKTLDTVQNSLKQYNVLINDSNHVIKHFVSLVQKDPDKEKASEFQRLLNNYSMDRERLSSLINDLENYQHDLSENRSVNLIPYIVLIFLGLIGITLVRKRT